MIKRINSILAVLITVSLLMVPVAAANEESVLVDEGTTEQPPSLTVEPDNGDAAETVDSQGDESDVAGDDAANIEDSLDEPSSEDGDPPASPDEEDVQNAAEDEKGSESSSETDEPPAIEDSSDSPVGEDIPDVQEPPADLEAAPQGKPASVTSGKSLNDDDLVVVTIIVTGNGAPLPYAYLSLWGSEDYWSDGYANEAGVAELSVPAGTYSISVSNYEHYEGTTLEDRVVDANNSTFSIDLVPRPTGTVQLLCSVNCSDHANASVNIRHDDDSGFWFSADITLDADGQGIFLNVPAAQNYELTVYPHGVFTMFQTTLAVESGEATTITPQYEEGPSGSVTFTFAHGDGAAITGGVIQLWNDNISAWSEFDESGTITLQLPVGRFEYEAYSETWEHDREIGNIEIEAGADLTVPIVFTPWPTVSATVVDSSGNPLEGVSVQLGTFDDDGYFSWFSSIYTDGDGSGSTRAPASADSWRVQPFGLWLGDAGNLTGDHTMITLEEVTETGVVTFTHDDNSESWAEITLTGENGWSDYLYVESGDAQSLDIPAGNYQWSASIGWSHHFQEGSFEIADGEVVTIGLEEFEAHPQFTVSVVNQRKEPAAGVEVSITGNDGSNAWAWLHLDDSGVHTSGLPYGDYRVQVFVPARYQPLEGTFEWTFNETSTTLEIELTELPNDDLTVQVNYDSTYGSLGQVWIQDSDNNIVAEDWVTGHEAVFTGLPHGDNYTLHTSESWWYLAFTSEPFSFDESTAQPLVIDLESLEPVELTVIASPADGSNRLPVSESLELTFNDGWSGSNIHLSRDDANGTLSGTTIVPKRVVSIDFFGWNDFYSSEDLPRVVDLTSVAGNEHVVHLTFAAKPHGLVTFDLDVPDDMRASGQIQIEQNGNVLDYLYFYEDQTSVTTSPLLAGEYTWRYFPQGAFLPTGGEFTIVDRDVSVPVQLRVGENGVIVVTTSFPTGIDDLQAGGYINVYDSDQHVVASRYMSNLNQAVVVGPVLFGNYNVEVITYDGRILSSDHIPVTVDAESVGVSVTLAAKPVLEPVMVRFEVSSDSEDPVIGGEIYTDAGWILLDENGHGEIDFAGYDEVYYQVSSLNFSVVYGEWVESDGNVIEIELTGQRPVLELTIVNEDNEPVSGLDVYSPDSARYAGDGVYLLAAWDQTATSIRLDIRDYSGVYLSLEDEVVPLDGMFTQHTITVVKAENVVSNVTLSVEFEGEYPTLDEDADEGIYVSLSSTTDGYWLYGFLDNDGTITFKDAREGEYTVYVSGFAERWLFDAPDPATVEIVESDSNISVHLGRLDLVSVTFMIETSDGAPLDSPSEMRLAPSRSQTVWEGLISNQLTVDMPAGEYSLTVNGTGAYLHYAGLIDVDADTGVVIIPMQRIAAVPVSEEAEPPVTETPTPTPTATATPDPVVTPPGGTTPTPTIPPTPVPPGPGIGQQSLIVVIELPGGADISGAPYSLYAPMASQQFMLEPFWQGVVGPNNTIEISGLLTGQYRLMIEPVGMTPIEVVINIGADEVTRVLLRVDEEGAATVHYGTQIPPAQTSPTAVPGTATTPPTSSTDAPVSGLPNTGTGTMGSSSVPLVAMIAAVLLATIAIPTGIAFGDRKKR